MNYTIDAKNKSLGRVASMAAGILMSKNSPEFEKNILSTNMVEIVNASLTKIDPKKLKEKLYEKYSGYPGGLKYTSLDKMIEKKGFEEVYRLAIYGMLPQNKLRPRLMKHLKVTN